MEKAGGGISSENLDTRLLRFRSRPSSEDGGSLSRALLSEGRNEEALEVANTGLKTSPEDGTLLLVQGQAYFRAGDLIRAQASLLKSARGLPRDKEPYRWLGEVLLKRGDPQRASKVLERAIALDPTDRSVRLLQERASRLARIAATGGSEPAPPRPDPSAYGDNDAPTRVGGPAAFSVAGGPDAFGHELPEAAPTIVDDDEPPTAVVSREELQGALQAAARLSSDPGAPAAIPPAPGRMPRAPKRTMVGLGGPAAPPAPVDLGPDPFAEGLPTNQLDLGPSPRMMGRPGPVAPPPPAFQGAPPPPAFQGAPPPPAFQGAPGSPLPRGPQAGFPPSPGQDYPRGPAAGFPPSPEAGHDPSRQAGFSPPAPPAPHGAFHVPPAPEPAPASVGDWGLEPDFLPSDFDYAPTDFDAPQPQLAGDVSSGGAFGRPEDVDSILRMLEREGIFEAPSGAAVQWAQKKDLPRGTNKLGRSLAVVWAIAVLLAGVGYFGWQYWIDARTAEARTLVEQAQLQALAGDHEDLVAAERNLRLARDLDPHDSAGPELLLFLHAQRALEDGTFEPGYMRPTLSRGREAEVSAAPLEAATAVLAAAEGDTDAAEEGIRQALEAAPEDPKILYVAGRLEQRLGNEAALGHLAAAVEGEPGLAAAAIALAEARADEGQPEEALEILDGVLARDSDHLRATLWRAFITADETDPSEGLAAIGALTTRLVEHGAATDAVLANLTRARFLRRQGEAEPAVAAVNLATEAGATEPRLLALVAAEAKSVGSLSRAQTAATAAVAGAPSNRDFRKLLASILLDRRDGLGALRTLASMPMEDPDVLLMSARAALLVGGDDTLNAAAQALSTFMEAQEDASVEIRALRIRTLVALGRAEEVLGDARTLARDAPGDPLAALALGEAALAARDPRLAEESLSRLVQASPDDADGHYLLGRAHRLGGDADAAERSFRQAIELLNEHVDARLALGRLLLDQGKYAEADRLYQELARHGGRAAGSSTALLGRLGRVEALVGLSRVDDAGVQLDNIREEDRGLAVVRIMAAWLALAKHQPGEAVSQIRPLAESEQPGADIVAIYGDALFGAGETEAANAQYERALSIDRGLPEALLGKAQVAVRAENPREARSFLDDAAGSLERRVRPPALRARLLFLRGRAFMLDGRSGRDEARRALRGAVELTGCPAEAWFFLGEALGGDNAPEAREAYERYLELDGEGRYAARARRAID